MRFLTKTAIFSWSFLPSFVEPLTIKSQDGPCSAYSTCTPIGVAKRAISPQNFSLSCRFVLERGCLKTTVARVKSKCLAPQKIVLATPLDTHLNILTGFLNFVKILSSASNRYQLLLDTASNFVSGLLYAWGCKIEVQTTWKGISVSH